MADARGTGAARGGRSRAGLAGAALSLALALALGACGDDEDGDEDRIVREAEELAESAGARGLAEAMRGLLLSEDVGDDVDRRSVSVLQEAADDLPGDPDVRGIADADGDGLDDDGKVELRVEDEAACLTVARGEDISVHNRAC